MLVKLQAEILLFEVKILLGMVKTRIFQSTKDINRLGQVPLNILIDQF